MVKRTKSDWEFGKEFVGQTVSWVKGFRDGMTQKYPAGGLSAAEAGASGGLLLPPHLEHYHRLHPVPAQVSTRPRFL
jgi:hypothetical protein